ncbi:MAG: histidine--tRNA ligase [Candidatus Paceibacteria bacterium]
MTNESKNKGKLGTEPYKGVRDFYPADQAVQNYILNKMRKTVESFGYVEYGASILEPTELYEAKSGEELVKEQTYTFKDRGDRNVTLRPEMTPSLARMIASKKRELSFPLRWYSIPNAFRYERPQRGRVREHWQLNADLFGGNEIDADTEIISLAYQIMKDFGAEDKDFEIKVSYAGMLAKYLKTEFEIDDVGANALVKMIDRCGKISDEDFEKKVSDVIGKDRASKLLKMLKEQNTQEFEKYDEIKYLEELKNKLGFEITIDPFLTRGFDYYTGMVFEVYDTNPENNRSVFGGGRYDNLLEVFGEEKIPAVGFGMGDVPVKNFLEVRDLIPEYVSTTDLAICTLAEENMRYAQELANKLRAEGLNIAVDLSDKKVGDQIKIADKQGVPYVICIGEEEEKSGQFKLKELKTGNEKEVSADEIKNIIL